MNSKYGVVLASYPIITLLIGFTVLVNVTDENMKLEEKGGAVFPAFPRDTSYTFINLFETDSTVFDSIFSFWWKVHNSNGSGYPPVVVDSDSDGYYEVIGKYDGVGSCWDGLRCYVRASEQDEYGIFRPAARYPDSTLKVIGAADFDRDGYVEVLIDNMEHNLRAYEAGPGSLAVRLEWIYHEEIILGGGSAKVKIADIDGDGYPELSHMSSSDTIPGALLRIAEYDTTERTLVTRFLWDYTEGHGPRFGLSYGDFDGDGLMSIAGSSSWGEVFVVEGKGDNDYVVTWTGSVAGWNSYYAVATNDVDGNGKPEFFIGEDKEIPGYGYAFRLTQFEAVEDDSFSAVAIVDILPGVGFFNNSLYAVDYDGDGTDEILVMVPGRVLLLDSNGPGSYEVVWVKHFLGKLLHGAAMVDIMDDDRLELLIGYDADVPSGGWKNFTNVFRYRDIVSVRGEGESVPGGFMLSEGYPNPFNSTVVFRYELPAHARVKIEVHDILGRTVKTLVDDDKPVGAYDVAWNGRNADGKGAVSGVYFVRMEIKDRQVMTRKVVLLK